MPTPSSTGTESEQAQPKPPLHLDQMHRLRTTAPALPGRAAEDKARPVLGRRTHAEAFNWYKLPFLHSAPQVTGT